jgi:flagellar protein FliS
MYTNPKTAYLTTRATSSVHDASPHKLIALLFDAALENLAIVKGSMQRKEIKQKVDGIRKVIEIVNELQGSLDLDKGGQVASNLDDLYTFCTNRLALANATNDVEKIDEVFRVIAELQQGWSEIAGTLST